MYIHNFKTLPRARSAGWRPGYKLFLPISLCCFPLAIPILGGIASALGNDLLNIRSGNVVPCRSQQPRGLRRRSTASRPLRLWVRIPPGAWMPVYCDCCVLSGRGLCDGLITRPLWHVVVCDQETSRMRRLKPATGTVKNAATQGCNAKKTNKQCSSLYSLLLWCKRSPTVHLLTILFSTSITRTKTVFCSPYFCLSISQSSFLCVFVNVKLLMW